MDIQTDSDFDPDFIRDTVHLILSSVEIEFSFISHFLRIVKSGLKIESKESKETWDNFQKSRDIASEDSITTFWGDYRESDLRDNYEIVVGIVPGLAYQSTVIIIFGVIEKTIDELFTFINFEKVNVGKGKYPTFYQKIEFIVEKLKKDLKDTHTWQKSLIGRKLEILQHIVMVI